MPTCNNCEQEVGLDDQYCSQCGEEVALELDSKSPMADEQAATSAIQKLTRIPGISAENGLSNKNILIGLLYAIGGPLFWIVAILYYVGVLRSFGLSRLPGIRATDEWSIKEIGIIGLYIFVVLPLLLLFSLALLLNAVGIDLEDDSASGDAEINGDAEAEESAADESDRDSDAITGEIETLDDLEDRLQDENIQVEYLDGEDYIWLDYVTAANTQEDEIEEVEKVAVAYADLVDSGSAYASQMLHVIFMDDFGNDLGGFFIVEEWAEEYAEGELTLEEYVMLIVEETFGYE